MVKLVFDGQPDVPYIRKGWKYGSNAKAVIHIPDKDIIPFFKLSDLKREHPEFAVPFTKAFSRINGNDIEVWIRKSDISKSHNLRRE